MEILKDPAIIIIIVEVIGLVIARLDKSDMFANLIIKLGEKLKSQ